jgi:hypothetical protein
VLAAASPSDLYRLIKAEGGDSKEGCSFELLRQRLVIGGAGDLALHPQYMPVRCYDEPDELYGPRKKLKNSRCNWWDRRDAHLIFPALDAAAAFKEEIVRSPLD